MDNDPVIHIVYIVALTAVKNLDGLVSACHLWRALPVLHGVEGICKGLAAAVVRNGDCPVSPGCRLFDSSFGAGKGIHIAHRGVQVQFHPLFALCQVLPLFHGARHHRHRLQDHLIIEFIHDQSTLDFQHRADFHAVQNRLGLIVFHKAIDAHGAVIISQIKVNDPGIALFQFLVLHIEHLALDNHNTHIQIQVLHGHALALERLAHNGLTLLRLGLALGFVLDCSSWKLRKHLPTHLLHSLEEGLPFQDLSLVDPDIHSSGKPLPQPAADLRGALLQNRLAVCLQMDVQSIPLPLPPCARQRAAAHGITGDKQAHQFLRLHFCQLVCRVGGYQLQFPQSIDGCDLVCFFIKPALGYVALCMDSNGYMTGVGVNIRSNNGRLRKDLMQVFRRLIVRKHIQKEYGVFHKFLKVLRFASEGQAAILHRAVCRFAGPSQKAFRSHRRRQFRYPPPGLRRGR